MSSSSDSDFDSGSGGGPIVSPPQKKPQETQGGRKDDDSESSDEVMADVSLLRGLQDVAATATGDDERIDVFEIAICTCSACGITSDKASEIHLCLCLLLNVSRLVVCVCVSQSSVAHVLNPCSFIRCIICRQSACPRRGCMTRTPVSSSSRPQARYA